MKSLYALRKFAKKISLLFLRFSPEFRCSNISAVTEHTRNQTFLRDISNLHFGPIRWVPRRFFKIFIFIGEICILIRDFWVIFENYSMRMLSIRRTDFIAFWAYEEQISAHAQPAVKCEHCYMYNPCWAYAERILSLTEHTGKCLKVEYIGRIEYDFRKSRVTGPWDHKVSVFAKKSQKKFMLVYL